MKPANVVVSPDGPVLIDFGIASREGAHQVSTSGCEMGSPGWTPGRAPLRIGDCCRGRLRRVGAGAIVLGASAGAAATYRALLSVA